MSVGRITYVAAIVGVALWTASACTDDRLSFVEQANFGDAGEQREAAACGYQCSIDGRAVIDTCTGVSEQCPPELACGAARCQEPCAAAAADQRSEGCDFYFQAPRYERRFGLNCHALFLVNSSVAPVEISLELDGEALDVSQSIYLTKPGESALTRHTGPLAPGESAIVFVSDAPQSVIDAEDTTTSTSAHCPADVVPSTRRFDDLPNGTGFGRAYHLKANLPLSVTSIYPFGGASSFEPTASLILPVAAWSKQHILINGWGAASEAGKPSAQIVASEDDTEVTLLPKVDIQDGLELLGKPARIPATYHLDKGQLLQLVQTDELSGSIVTSTKPTTIFGGNSCAYVPNFGAACDILHQQIPGFERWGSEYVGVGYRPRQQNEHEPMAYRIVAARDGTRLDYDPAVPSGAPLTMSAGEIATFTQGTGDAFVVRTQDADHAIYLAAYMSGAATAFGGTGKLDNAYAGQGDPEFVNVVPTGQFLNAYSFYADPTYKETSLVVVRAKSNGEFKDVWLECAGNLTGFRPVGTRGDYEWTRVDLQRNFGPGDEFGDSVCRTGLQRMHSEGPFTATLWGWANYASYAYPGGMAQRSLVTTPLAPIR